MPIPSVAVRTTTTKRWELTEDEIADLVRKALGVPLDADVHFDVGQGLRGVTVTVTEESYG